MRTAGRVGALAAAVALPVLLALRWFAVPRTYECGWFCYSPILPGQPPPAPVLDATPVVRHTSSGLASLSWPVLAVLAAAVLGGLAVALVPRLGRVVAVVATAALVVLVLAVFVEQPGLHARWPSQPSGEGRPRLTDPMVDVGWPAVAGTAALAALAIASLAAARGRARRPT